MAIPRFASVEAISRSATDESYQPEAWAGRPQALTSSIRIGRCLIAEHDDHEGESSQCLDSKTQAEFADGQHGGAKHQLGRYP